MNVVFLSYAYPPLKFPRAIQVSRLVKHSGHAIRVLAGDEDSGRDATLGDGGRAREVVRLRREPLDPRSLRSWWLRVPIPDVCRDWAQQAGEEIRRRGWLEPDSVLVTFGDPMSDHLAGLELKRATGVPWIAHFSDPWSDNPYRRQMPPLGAINRRLEARVVEHADRLVFTSRETVDVVMRKYPAPWRAKARVLPHAFDPGLYPEAQPAHGGIVIRHIGNFYRHRTPEPLVNALLRLQRESPAVLDNVRVELVGGIYGGMPMPAGLERLPPGMVAFRPPVDYLESLALMKTADLLVVIDAPSELSVFLPSKLVDYLGAGRPILALSPPGASAELVARLGGLAVHPDDEAAAAGALARLLDAARSGAGREDSVAVRAEYEAAAVASRFDAIVTELARK